ncbi:alpha/beta hydrolase [Elioraea sp.]|uniref:alpha/beta hydrolase n=1 Tax=Elioraea sp. TaxID=2185103 RepID=UPI003F6FCAA2
MATTLVHFATNREELFEGEEVVGFGPRLNPKSPLWLRYGAAEMAPPKKRSAPFGLAGIRVAPEQIPGVTAEAGGAPVFGSDAVFEGLRLRLIENDADLLLMLHGYACDFGCALSNAAELKTQWSTKATPLETAIFAWPADGKIVPWLSYASDRDDARSSAKAVARSLHRLMAYLRALPSKDWCRADIHLVAHSMGNYMLRNALQALVSDLGGRPLPRLFKTIFLMAADEDSDAFEDPKKFARLPELAESVQVYFARNDRALMISDLSKGNPDRLGTTGPRTLTALPQKVTLVDCTEVSETSPVSDANHQYYRKRAEVLADVRQVLAGAAPEQVSGREWVPARSCFRIKPAKR